MITTLSDSCSCSSLRCHIIYEWLLVSYKVLYLCYLAHDSYEYRTLNWNLFVLYFVYIRLHNRMNNIYISRECLRGGIVLAHISKKLWVHNSNNCMISQLGITMKFWSHMQLCTPDQSGSVYLYKQDIKTLKFHFLFATSKKKEKVELFQPEVSVLW